MKNTVSLLPAVLALATALPSPSTPSTSKNLIKDPSFEDLPNKDLNKTYVGKDHTDDAVSDAAGGWVTAYDAVILSNAMSPGDPTPYGDKFARFQYLASQSHNYSPYFVQLGEVAQALPVTPNGTYATAFWYRVTNAPTHGSLSVDLNYHTIPANGNGSQDVDYYLGGFLVPAGTKNTGWQLANFTGYSIQDPGTGRRSIEFDVFGDDHAKDWILDIDEISLTFTGAS